jgi:hypothetical protein
MKSNQNDCLHIGKVIEDYLFEMNISLSEISERIDIPKQEILKLSKVKRMDVMILYKWCLLLRLDFFALFSYSLDNEDDSITLNTMTHNIKFKKV